MNARKAITLTVFFLLLAGCQSGPKPYRSLNITYQHENYRVPKDEIWKLTWKSPYKAGDITPVYDVRVLSYCFTSAGKGTLISAYSCDPGEYGLLDVCASIDTPAELWIPSDTEFYIANDLIKVHVEIFKNDPGPQ